MASGCSSSQASRSRRRYSRASGARCRWRRRVLRGNRVPFNLPPHRHGRASRRRRRRRIPRCPRARYIRSGCMSSRRSKPSGAHSALWAPSRAALPTARVLSASSGGMSPTAAALSMFSRVPKPPARQTSSTSPGPIPARRSRISTPARTAALASCNFVSRRRSAGRPARG